MPGIDSLGRSSSLIITEKENPVLPDRAAERPPELVLIENAPRRRRKVVARIEIGIAQEFECVAMKRRSMPDFVTTVIYPPLNSPYSASKLLVRIRNSAMESRLGMMPYRPHVDILLHVRFR